MPSEVTSICIWYFDRSMNHVQKDQKIKYSEKNREMLDHSACIHIMEEIQLHLLFSLVPESALYPAVVYFLGIFTLPLKQAGRQAGDSEAKATPVLPTATVHSTQAPAAGTSVG